MTQQSTIHTDLANAFEADVAKAEAKMAEVLPALVELTNKARWAAIDAQSIVGSALQSAEIRDGSRFHGAETGDAAEAVKLGQKYVKTVRQKIEVEQKLAAMAEAARELDRIASDLRHLKLSHDQA